MASTVSQINELLEALKNGKSQAIEKPTVADTPKYERKEYAAPSDNDISSAASAELGDYKNSGKKAIEKEYKTKGEELSANKESIAETGNKTKSGINSAYDSAAENVSNDMLKRGLARSSIAVNKNAEVEQGRASALSETEAQVAAATAKLDEEINSLTAELQSALDDFDIAYAAKLQTRITEMKAERDKTAAEVIEYNNTLTQKELQQEREKAELESKLYSDLLEQREAASDAKMTESELKVYRESNYNLISMYLNTLSKSAAKNVLLGAPELRGYIGDTYLSKLYGKYVG